MACSPFAKITRYRLVVNCATQLNATQRVFYNWILHSLQDIAYIAQFTNFGILRCVALRILQQTLGTFLLMLKEHLCTTTQS